MKINVYVADGPSSRRICWYEGTSDAQVEKAIRIQLRLPRDSQFLLRDADGDVVPVSSTMPNGHHYTIVQEEGEEMDTSVDFSPIINTPITSEVTSPLMMPRPLSTASSPKRRKLDEAISTSSAASPAAEETGTPTTVNAIVDKDPPHHMTIAIAHFVDTFTQPIANDDNVNFIPNRGRYALHALYNQLVRDVRLQPNREDVFYKITSGNCKVDRQRVNRYYRCPAQSGGGMEYVQFKPQGKGVLLRQYRNVNNLEVLKDAVKTLAPFVSWLDPTDVVEMYVRFMDGFVPIDRSDYNAYRR